MTKDITYELGVIGAGNMAEAILKAELHSGFLGANEIVVSDCRQERRQKLASELGVSWAPDNLVPAQCPRVLLSVKPQNISEVLEEVADVVGRDALVISICAGVPTSLIDGKLSGKGHIVRVMPNTPMLVGAGMSGIAAGPRATDDDVQWTEGLFAASGKTVPVDECLMDAVTAVSGTGPAYFFYLIEAMVAAGMAEGLSYEFAYQLSVQTCAGAAKMLTETGRKPEDLRAQVTSPNGTTQRAVETLDAANTKDAWVAAIRAAAQRSRELGGEMTK
ncbi:MAG: pyrroline-5-carboxylate reductase [Planctomycetota bacterium]|jgi:pyrroline-5-carboxylate reductase